MKVYRIHQGEEIAVYDLMEVTYSGKDMGERSLTAKILTDHIIDFKIGDYVKLEMQNLMRSVNGYSGGMMEEKFYLYNLPTIKKTARNESSGNAFEMTVVFYPRQYELGLIQMRDLLQKDASGKDIIFTGFSEVKFYGGAHELLMRIQAVLDDYFKDKEQEEKWSYVLSDEVNEHKNPALESFSFTFSDNSLMDALLKLNDPEGINTTFFINGRTIYVGFKRPYMCRVQTSPQDDITVSQYPFELAYGKTSHLPLDKHSGGLFDITKTPGKESPITKLYAYGGSRNLNRYYNADVVKSGRYVNKLMLPSFSHDGKTDYIFRQEMVDKFGLREGSKQFENVFPSIENIRYGYIRSIKYCIKILTKGHGGEEDDYPIMRIQCFKVVPILDANNKDTGINTLQESYPPEDLAIYIHGYQDDKTVRESKVLKCVLYGGNNAQQRQSEADFGHLPTDENGAVIPGACYAVHDRGFDEEGTQYICETREEWFTYVETARTEEEKEILKNQLQYVDDFWATDVHVFNGYDSDVFIRDGYSMYCYPRINANYSNGANSDSLLVNEVVAVRPITKTDTVDGRGSEDVFDIYMRDLGFRIDEQSLGGGGGNGQMVFLTQGNILVHFKTGNLAGMEFTVRYQNEANSSVFCAFMEDGTENPEFFRDHDDKLVERDPFAEQAFRDGAIWRFRAERQAAEPEYRADYYLPNKDCNAQAGDRVVLLDICMPDIYIKAAEHKLEEEAWKYYDKNCKDHTAFSVSFDKVRFQQIPLYALQMREGLNMRIIDDDLKIEMMNRIRSLMLGESIVVSNTSMRTILSDHGYTTYTKNTIIETTNDKDDVDSWFISKDWEKLSGKIKLPKSEGGISYGEYLFIDVFSKYATEDYRCLASVKCKLDENTVHEIDGYYEIDIQLNSQEEYEEILKYAVPGQQPIGFGRTYHFTLPETVQETVPGVVYKYANKGSIYYSNVDQLINFKSGKYYEVVMDLESKFYEDDDIDKTLFRLSDNIGSEKISFFIPNYTVTNETSDRKGFVRRKFSFQLPENFNDKNDYYIVVRYIADGMSDSSTNILVSVIEKDFEEGEQVLKYRDFIADQVTIKIQDNTREEGYRLVNMIPEAIKEISATLAEKTSASSWAALNNKVEELSNESEQIQQTQEMRARNARINAFNLMQLRENIFDPDSDTDRYAKCSPDFLRKMMLQIGADSMNYQLDKTFQGADGSAHNYFIEYSQQYHCEVFDVMSADILRHFVFNRADGQSTWNIPASSQQLVASGGVYPVYYVSIKCSISDNTGQWVIDTLMHKVNEEANYFYFNWGILMPDTDGHYTLMETRGCAYMYGDNLVVGKIKSLAGNSYFDLNNGNFVLSNGDISNAALSFINGVLTIKGIATEEQIDDVIERLGLVEVGVDEAIRKAQEAEQNAKNYANVLKDDLQKQIDGVVDSYFLEGVPSMKTDRKPLSDWQAEAGQGQPIDYAKHEGDTYTDVLKSIVDLKEVKSDGATSLWLESGSIERVLNKPFEELIQSDNHYVRTKGIFDIVKGNTITFTSNTYQIQLFFFNSSKQLASGTAWSSGTATFVLDDYIASEWKYFALLFKASDGSVITNPSAVLSSLTITKTGKDITYPFAGHSWRFCNNDDSDPTTWHWHEIADSDAVLALQKAAEAQDTADGKRRVFTTQPVPPYDKGDMWAQGGSVGDDLLYCVTPKTIDQSFAQSDWEPASSALYEATKEVGGANLIGESNPFTIEKEDSDYNYKIFVGKHNNTQAINPQYLDNGAKYVFSCKKAVLDEGTATKFDVRLYDFDTNVSVTKKFDFNKEVSDVFEVPATGNFSLIVYAGEAGSTADNTVTFYDMMLQKGERKTAYSSYYKHITDALKGSTEIAGGLVMSHLLMLKNESGSVISGMSGLQGTQEDPENVLLWSGGTYQDALEQLQGLIEKLPVLITKSGIGSKIGPFEIMENSILLKTVYGKFELSQNGIQLYKDGVDNPVVSIAPTPITIPSGEITTFNINTATRQRLNTSNYGIGLYLSNGIDITGGSMKLILQNLRIMVDIPRVAKKAQKMNVYLKLMHANTGSTFYSEVFSKQFSVETQWDEGLVSNFDINETIYGLSSGNYVLSLRFYHLTRTHTGDWYVDTNQYIEYTIGSTVSGSSIVSQFVDLKGEPYTQIGSDGILVYQNNSKYIMLKNADNDILLAAPGLPTNPDSLQVGTIWNNGGVLNIKQ